MQLTHCLSDNLKSRDASASKKDSMKKRYVWEKQNDIKQNKTSKTEFYKNIDPVVLL